MKKKIVLILSSAFLVFTFLLEFLPITAKPVLQVHQEKTIALNVMIHSEQIQELEALPLLQT